MSAHPPIIGVADVMDDQHKTVEVVGELPRIRQECCHTCAVLVAPPEHLSKRVKDDKSGRNMGPLDCPSEGKKITGLGTQVGRR